MIKFELFDVTLDLFLTSLAPKVRLRTFSENTDHRALLKACLQVPACKMEPRTGSITCLSWLAGRPATQPARPPQSYTRRKDPTYLKFYWEPVLMCCVPPYRPPFQKVCAVSPLHIGTLFRKYVRCPHLPVYTFSVWCQFSSVPWTLWLCLGFWAKLRNWQVPVCKMKSSAICILKCGTPSWACHAVFFSFLCDKNLRNGGYLIIDSSEIEMKLLIWSLVESILSQIWLKN